VYSEVSVYVALLHFALRQQNTGRWRLSHGSWSELCIPKVYLVSLRWLV